MDTIAFSAFKSEITAEIWPNGVPENLVAPINKYFADALVHIQRFVECLQEDHVDVFPACATYTLCGLTVLDAPRGRIRKLYTIQGEWCDPITYRQTKLSEVKCWSRRFTELVTAPANEGFPTLPMGFKYAEESTDSLWGRALQGLWAIEKSRIFVAPWIQSRESVVIEWDGLKRKWADTDLVPDEDDLKRAVRLWVQKEYARDFERDLIASKAFASEFETQLADLIFECREETRTRKTDLCPDELEHVSEHQNEDNLAAPAVTPVTVFGVISDYGTRNQNSWDVASMIKSWNPNAIVTTGDNNYQGGHTGTYDEAVGWLFRNYIYPYTGTQPLWAGEEDATENRFWPAPGNHDCDNLAGYLNYFPHLPGNGRYYDVVVGAVHFFVLNSGKMTSGVEVEADGIRWPNLQGSWLKARLAQSVARWKVVLLHVPPHSSYRYPGDWTYKWPFKEWGADVLLCGHNHNYERLEIDGFPYIVCGMGGGGLYTFTDQIVSGSVVRHAGDYGALRGTATCDTLTLECITLAGQVIDTLTLV